VSKHEVAAGVHFEQLDSTGAQKIMAMTKVFERLFLGDAHDADSLAVNNPFGITGVLNVSTETNQMRREGIKYAHHPLDEYE